MTYRDTARAYVKAATSDDRWSPDAGDLDAITRSIPRHQATGYEPARTARKHIECVENLAAELREAMSEEAQGNPWPGYVAALETAARALLAAIGEGE